MYCAVHDRADKQQRDGRLTIILLFMLGLLLFCWHQQQSADTGVFIRKYSFLETGPDNLLYLRPEATMQQPLASLQTAYYPIFFLPLPINSADKELLMTIKGIGPQLAETIINHRKTVGPILDSAQLQKIHGIGRKRAAALSDHLIFDTVE